MAGVAALLLLAGCAGEGQRRRPREGFRPSAKGAGTMRRGALFISPMGEPFRGEGDPATRWFAGADKNGDGRLTLVEMTADAARFFATLDVDGNGEIGPDEIDRYEREIAPEINVAAGPRAGGGMPGGGERRGGGGRPGGRGGGGGPPPGGGSRPGERGAGGMSGGGGRVEAPQLQGAARFGYLAIPEPVTAADTDFNRGVTRAEFFAAAARRFALLDRNNDGAIMAAELPRIAGRGR